MQASSSIQGNGTSGQCVQLQGNGTGQQLQGNDGNGHLQGTVAVAPPAIDALGSPTPQPVGAPPVSAACDTVWQGAPQGACRTVELCAGTAVLSAQLAEAGFPAIAVDRARPSKTLRFPTMALDLTVPENWESVRRLLEDRTILYVHWSVP